MKPDRTERRATVSSLPEKSPEDQEIEETPGPSFSTLMLELREVAYGSGMESIRTTLANIMPRDEAEARQMVGRMARLRMAAEMLHTLSLELAFAPRGR